MKALEFDISFHRTKKLDKIPNDSYYEIVFRIVKLLGLDTMKDISSKNKTKPNNLVQAIERVSLIIDILCNYPQKISVGKLSEKLGFPKGTIHRLLSSLAYFDYVRKDPISSLSLEKIAEVIQDKRLHHKTEYTITNPLTLKEHLKLVQEQGCAIDYQENEKGVCCVRAPIMDRKTFDIKVVIQGNDEFRIQRNTRCL